MNYLCVLLGLLALASADSDNERAIAAVIAGAGLNNALRESRG